MLNGLTGNTPKVTINGKPFNAQVKKLSDDMTPREANRLLADRKDGFDTIGAKLNGEDVLIIARTSENLKTTDRVQVDGTAAKIQFVENEDNTRAETTGMSIAGAIQGTAGGALIGLMGTYMVTGGGDWINVTPKGAAIAIGTVALAVGTIGYLAGRESMKILDQSLIESITKK